MLDITVLSRIFISSCTSRGKTLAEKGVLRTWSDVRQRMRGKRASRNIQAGPSKMYHLSSFVLDGIKSRRAGVDRVKKGRKAIRGAVSKQVMS